MNSLAPKDKIWLSGGYDMEPEWLAGAEGYLATVVGYWPGQNENDCLVVVLEEPLVSHGTEGRYLVLELRYKGSNWCESEIVHLELLPELPEYAKWQHRKQGKWIESHASYKKLEL